MGRLMPVECIECIDEVRSVCTAGLYDCFVVRVGEECLLLVKSFEGWMVILLTNILTETVYM